MNTDKYINIMQLAQANKAKMNAEGNEISFSEAVDSVTANIGLDKNAALKQAKAVDEKLSVLDAKKTAARVQAYKAKMDAPHFFNRMTPRLASYRHCCEKTGLSLDCE